MGNIFPQDMFYTEEDILDEDLADSPQTLSPVSGPSAANFLPVAQAVQLYLLGTNTEWLPHVLGKATNLLYLASNCLQGNPLVTNQS